MRNAGFMRPPFAIGPQSRSRAMGVSPATDWETGWYGAACDSVARRDRLRDAQDTLDETLWNAPLFQLTGARNKATARSPVSIPMAGLRDSRNRVGKPAANFLCLLTCRPELLSSTAARHPAWRGGSGVIRERRRSVVAALQSR